MWQAKNRAVFVLETAVAKSARRGTCITQTEFGSRSEMGGKYEGGCTTSKFICHVLVAIVVETHLAVELLEGLTTPYSWPAMLKPTVGVVDQRERVLHIAHLHCRKEEQRWQEVSLVRVRWASEGRGDWPGRRAAGRAGQE